MPSAAAATTATTDQPPAKKAATRRAAPAKRAPRKAAAAAPAAPVETTPTPADTVVLEDLPLASVLPNLRNVRRDIGDVSELADSIEQVGLLEPLVVAPHGPDRWVLIAGHRRHAALEKLGRATAPCLIRAGLTTEHDQILAMLVENLQRSDLTPIEEATAYEQLTIAGFKAPDIAQRTGRSRATVEQRLRLMDLPEATRARVHHHQVTLAEAEALLEFADEPDVLAGLEKAAGGRDFHFELGRARNGRENRLRRQTAESALRAHGVKVIDAAASQQVFNQNIRKWDLTPEEHYSCPGAAAWISPGAYVEHYCLQPDLHGGVPAPAASQGAASAGDVPAAEAAAVDPEVARDQEDCAVAARLRRDFLLGITTSRAALPADDARVIVVYLVRASVDEVIDAHPEEWCAWLTRDDLAKRPYEEWEQLLAGLIAPDSARDPHRTLLAMLAAGNERELAKLRNWTRWLGQDGYAAWLALLQELGYDLSTWEQAKVDAAAVAVDQDQAADQDDGDQVIG